MLNKLKYFFIFIIINLPLFSQINIKGKVVNYKNEPIKYITIQILDLKIQTHSNHQGEFAINNLSLGEHRFYLFGSGVRPKDTVINITSSTNNLIILVEDSYKIKKDIVITGTRTAKQIENLPIATEVVTDNEIKDLGGLRLNEILAEETGLNMIEGDGHGVQIQGLDPQYSMILINGEPVIGRNRGILDLARLAVGNIKRIEIVKGPSSSLYGSYALAGVINLITEAPENPLNLKLSSRYGSFNTIDFTIDGGLNFLNNKIGINLFLNRLSSDGYSEEIHELGNIIPQYVNYTFSSEIYYKLFEQTQLKFGARLNTENQENFFLSKLNGIDAVIDDTSKLFDFNANFNIKQQIDEDLNIELRNYYTIYNTDIQYTYRQTGDEYDHYTFDQELIKSELQTNYMASRKHVLTAGGGITFEKASAERLAEGSKKSQLYYAFIQDDWLYSNSVNIISSLRYDNHSIYSDNLSPKIAASYEPFNNLIFKASIGTGFKAPSFQQLYMDFTNSLVGYSVFGTHFFHETIKKLEESGVIEDYLISPEDVKELSAEKSISFNAGFTYAYSEWFDFKINFYRNNLRDMIDVQPVAQKTNGQQVWTYFNLNRVYTQGFESEITLSPIEQIKLTLGYQFLEAYDQDVIEDIKNEKIFKVGKTGINRPVQLVEYGGLMNRSKHTLQIKIKYINTDYDFNIYLRGRYRSPYGYQDNNGNKILDNDDEYADDYSIWNLTFNKSFFNKKLNLQFGIDNILDYRPERFLTANPGRVYYIGLRYFYESN